MSKFKTVKVTIKIEDAVNDAVSDVEELASEMREWCDKLEESEGLSQTSKHDEVSDAADTLENASGELGGISLDSIGLDIRNTETVVYENQPYGHKPEPRWMRLGRVTSCLQGVVEEFERLLGVLPDDDAQRDGIESLRDEIDNVVSELEGVLFPGMY